MLRRALEPTLPKVLSALVGVWISGCIEQHPDFVIADGGADVTGAGTDPSGPDTTSTSSATVTSDVATDGPHTSTTSGDATGRDLTTSGEDTTGDDDTAGETIGECVEIGEDCECLPGDVQSCYTGDPDTLGVGVCDGGSMQCEGGVWGPCESEVLPSPEVCNGLDDDCNGSIDDGFGQVTCGLGICQVTVDECVDGEPFDCVPGEPEPEELCNGLDDTCDGVVDEGCPCVHGDVQSCYSGPSGTEDVGICEAGEQVCEEGAWGPCEGDTTPAPETCNGLDDDCDGVIDDGNPGGGGGCNTGLLGLCGIGQLTCQDASLQCVQQHDPEPEICDGLDNSCNGFVDDGNPGGGESCSTGQLGVCAEGTTACQMGSLVCQPNNTPTPEICDGLDNNCDGAIDNGNPGGGQACDTGLQGVCAPGTTACHNGEIACTQNTAASAEVCDGQDNDCNGIIDDGNPGSGQSCNTGLLGVCASGLTDCQNGSLACVQQTQASLEICDGLDNNCNGLVDEGNPGGGDACNTGQLGVCAEGTTACQNGGIVCQANTSPSPEICDGLDNDCDGAIDEGNPGGGLACDTGEPGVCAAGTTACIGGEIVCLGNQGPTSEICDGQDNDCDGVIDNGDPGGGLACNTGLAGVCAAGTTACEDGSIVCNQDVQPSPEVCDGQDNDCNGFIDDGNPGGGAWCDTGLAGICQDGTLTCQSGSLQCMQNQQPVAEICGDGLDNDCNGFVDDGCPCAHSKCNTGVALDPLCADPCVAQICNQMPSCCTDSWTTSCVDAVQTICGCGNCAFGCSHNICAEGAALVAGCDPGCVSSVCSVDPFCCNSSWDSICVSQVGTEGNPPTWPPVCNLSCDC